MKKLNYFLLGAAALTLASCSNEDLVNPGVVGDGNYNITVKLPADMGTRALSDGLTADVLRIAVYDADDNNSFVFQDEASFGGAIQTTVSLNLPQGKTYKIAFFAVSEAADGTLYTFNPEDGVIDVDYENAYKSDLNLADDYDCFYYLYEMEAPVPSTPTSETVTLYRPVAQINWGTNDLSQGVVAENAFGPNGQYLVSNFEMAGAYSQFSLLDSDVTGTTSTITLSGLASPASNPESAAWAFPVNPAVYKYIAMQYVLAPKEQELFTLSLDAYNNPDKSQANVDNEVINVSNAPVQANFRTNIYGSLLTNPNEFTVIKDPNWNAMSYDPSLELAIKRGGYFTLEHDFELSTSQTVSKDLTIDLNGYNITSNLPNDEGMLYVTNGANLTIKGEGTFKTNGQTEEEDGVDYPICTFVFVDGGTATIEGGTYECDGPGQLIYCYKGTIYIKGGSYNLGGTTLGLAYYYPINCQDDNYEAGTANIIVTGGSFYNFNPADNKAERGGANFVPNGYDVITSGPEGDQWFTVVPAGTSAVTNDTELKSALAEATSGDTIYIEAGSYGTLPTGWPAGVTVECAPGTIFNGQSNPNINGSTIKGATFQGTDYSLRGTVNGNFINCEFLGGGNNARWLYAGETAYFEGCLFSGTTYGCHFDGGANPLTFKSCTFQGFNAFGAAITLLTFESCTFESNNKSAYNGINCWGTTVMNHCNFIFDGSAKTEWIDALKQITMYDCLINGVSASSPQVADYIENYDNVIFR